MHEKSTVFECIFLELYLELRENHVSNLEEFLQSTHQQQIYALSSRSVKVSDKMGYSFIICIKKGFFLYRILAFLVVFPK